MRHTFPERVTQIEALLHAAADEEPAGAACLGLVARALSRRRQAEVKRQQRLQAMGRLALLLVGVGLLAMLSGDRGELKPDRVSTPKEAPANQVVSPAGGAPATREVQPEPRFASSVPRPVYPVETERPERRTFGSRSARAIHRVRTARTARRPGRAFVVLARHRPHPGPSRFARRPSPPAAQWQVEVVRHDVARVLMPAWLVRADAAGEGWLVAPAVLDVPIASVTRTLPLPPSLDPEASGEPPASESPARMDGEAQTAVTSSEETK